MHQKHTAARNVISVKTFQQKNEKGGKNVNPKNHTKTAEVSKNVNILNSV